LSSGGRIHEYSSWLFIYHILYKIINNTIPQAFHLSNSGLEKRMVPHGNSN
jgi:hypothetical protein